MLDPNPSTRLDARSCLGHQFFDKVNDLKLPKSVKKEISTTSIDQGETKAENTEEIIKIDSKNYALNVSNNRFN